MPVQKTNAKPPGSNIHSKVPTDYDLPLLFQRLQTFVSDPNVEAEVAEAARSLIGVLNVKPKDAKENPELNDGWHGIDTVRRIQGVANSE